jgi:transcriptional regulator with XRE-family HTH domain
MTDGEKLRIIRDDLLLTQAEMAHELGVAQQTISHLERGHNTDMSIDMLRRLVKRFNVNPYFFLTENVEPMFAAPTDALRRKLLEYDKLIDRLHAMKTKGAVNRTG